MSLYGWPLLCALGVGALAGAVGSFLVWRRLGLFADALAHASLPVAALAATRNFPTALVLVPFGVIFGLYLSWLEKRGRGDVANFLPILYSGLFGVGIVWVSTMGLPSHALMNLALGDLLLVTDFDFWVIAAVGIAVAGYLWCRWKDLVLISLNPDLALARGVPVGRRSAELMALLGLVVTSGLRVTGVILMTTLLTVPAVVSSHWSRSLKTHFVLALLLGAGIASGGLALSIFLDWATGPSVAILGAFVFAKSWSLRRILGR